MSQTAKIRMVQPPTRPTPPHNPKPTPPPNHPPQHPTPHPPRETGKGKCRLCRGIRKRGAVFVQEAKIFGGCTVPGVLGTHVLYAGKKAQITGEKDILRNVGVDGCQGKPWRNQGRTRSYARVVESTFMGRGWTRPRSGRLLGRGVQTLNMISNETPKGSSVKLKGEQILKILMGQQTGEGKKLAGFRVGKKKKCQTKRGGGERKRENYTWQKETPKGTEMIGEINRGGGKTN